MQSSSLSQSSQPSLPPLPPPLHAQKSTNNNNHILGGIVVGPGMKHHVTLGPDGRPSLAIEEMMSEDEARRRREQLNRRPSYRQILKDLETVGDKPMKRELDESADRIHIRQNGLGGLSNGTDGNSPYGSPISSNNDSGNNAPLLRNRNDSGNENANNMPSGMLLSSGRLNMAPPQSLANRLLNTSGGGDAANSAVSVVSSGGCGTNSTSNGLTSMQQQHLMPVAATAAAAGPLISAAVAAAVGNSLILPTSGGCADLISLKPPASTVAAADALSAAVSAAANTAFSQSNEWKNNLLYNSPSANLNNASGSSGGIGPANTPGSMTSLSDTDDNNRKRQVRLLKNREAAKECRRKKKEYVKCLENRVNVLENQNKALIDELKTLKELYCRKEKSELP